MINKEIPKINKFNTVNVTLGNLFYYLFWILMLLVKGIGWYDGMPVYNICLLAGAFFIGMKICLTEHSIAEWIFILVLSSLGIIAYFNSHEKGILLAILTLIGLKGISLRHLFKIGLVVWGGCFLIMTILGNFDLVLGSIMAHEKNGLGLVLRKSLGYTHPNVLHVSFAILVAFILYLLTKKGLTKYILLMVGNIYIFLYSFSYTGFLFVSLLIFSDFYFTYRHKISKPERFILQCILPFCLVFSIVGPHVLDQDGALYRLIDKLMNVRFFASRVVMDTNPLSLFGTELQLNGWALDSSYVNLLLTYGIVLFILFVLLFFAVVHSSLKRDDRKASALLISFLITGVMEPFLVNTAFKNLTWLFAGAWIFEVFFKKEALVNHPLWGRAILLLKQGNKLLAVPRISFDIRLLYPTWAKQRILYVLVAIIIGLACGFFSYMCMPNPPEIYIGRQNTDITSELDEYYIDTADLPVDFQGIIYAYQDSDSPLYRLPDQALQFERLRKSISIGGGVLAVTLMIPVLLLPGGRLLHKRKKGQ
ncbi:MAG: hypothetical protein LBV33_08105 [Lachnospiraceae bacterium]|nr:hypothetical protein [Lachnospiraceae bacterium]